MLKTGNIYLYKILRNTLCWTLWEHLFTQNTEEYCMLSTLGKFIYTKYLGLLLVEHCWNIDLYKILGNTLCWPMWEYLFTQNTEEYFLLSTVGRFIYTKYRGILLCWALCEDLFTQNTEEYFVEDYVKIYLHKILRNTVCWAL